MIITNDIRKRVRFQVTSGLLVTLMSISAFGQALPEHQWTQLSWVDVFSAPQKGTKVIGNWVTNTEVVVKKRDGDWCRASTVATAQYESISEGYVACSAIGDRKLTLKDDVHLDGRAFWIAPSVQRFAEVGQRLNYTALTSEQNMLQTSNKTPIRFPIPEFEAMKQRLTRGVIPDVEWELARVDVKAFHHIGGEDWRRSGEVIEYVKTLDPHKNLPAIKPSLFKRHADALLYEEIRPDSVAAMLGKANGITFSGKPEWVSGHYDEGVSAIWDIGRIDVKYAAPVTIHSVSRVGLVGARKLESTTVYAYSPAEGCRGGYGMLPNGIDVPGYPRLKEHPLISFVLPDLLPVKKIDVLSRKAKVIAHTDPYSGPKHVEERTIVVHAIDVDGDAIPDFAIIEMGAVGYMMSQYYHFINVSGSWWYAGSESYEECT